MGGSEGEMGKVMHGGLFARPQYTLAIFSAFRQPAKSCPKGLNLATARCANFCAKSL